jgi:hypothetical protein
VDQPSSQPLPLGESSSSSPEEDSIAQAAAAASAFINPGPYEQAPQELKRLVMLDTHDGFRCDINKQLSPYMAVGKKFCWCMLCVGILFVVTLSLFFRFRGGGGGGGCNSFLTWSVGLSKN